MARKSFVQLAADLLTSFPDNNQKLITAADLRAYFNSFLDAIRPAYGLLSRSVATVQNITATFQPLVFDTSFISDVPDYTANPATGTLTRLEAGTVRLLFNGAISGTNGTPVFVALFKNGVQTAWETGATATGAGEPVNISLNALSFDAGTAAYELRVRSTGAQAITFSDMDYILETVPVNSY